ncbi:hypothetical protein AusDCA_1777 [Desulfitobacterium sp. AusDCA]
MICLFIQKTDVLTLLKLLVMGFLSTDKQLKALVDGVVMVSMLKVTAIVCFSSTYAGIFEGIGLFNGLIDPKSSPMGACI